MCIRDSICRRRDPRRMADRASGAHRRRARAWARRLRAPDPPRRARAARERARRRRPPAARIHALRRAVVRVLAATAPGEPGDGGHDRARHCRPPVRPRLLIWPLIQATTPLTITDAELDEALNRL